MGVTELRRLRQLEEENQRLKRLVADLSLDKEMLQEVIKKSSEAGSASGGAFSAGGLPYQCPTGMRTADAEQNRLPQSLCGMIRRR